MIRSILELDIPFQISSAALNSFFARRKVMKLLRTRQNCILATDCHNCADRPAEMGRAMSVLKRKVSRSRLEEIVCCANELIEA